MNISSAGSDASYMPGAGPSAVGNFSAANRGSVNDSNVTVLEVKKQLKPLTFYTHLISLTILCALLQVLWQSARVYGALTTTEAHTFTLSNLHGIMAVPILFMTRKEVHRYELVGLIAGIIGTVLLFIDPDVDRVDGQDSHVWPDFVLLLSNAAALPLFALNRSLMQRRFLSHLFIMNVITMLAFTLAAVVIEGANLSMNKSTGVFGWTQNDDQFKMIILLGFGATFWGTAVGYTLIMRFWSPVVAMNMLLLEPILAQIYGVAFDVD